jgi:hypothetical protein
MMTRKQFSIWCLVTVVMCALAVFVQRVSSAEPSADPVISTAPVDATGIATSPGPHLDAAVAAFEAGHVLAALIGLVIAVMFTVRAAVPRLRSHRVVGWAMNVVASAGATVAAANVAGQPLTWSLLLSAVVVALGAAGGWQVIKDIGGRKVAPECQAGGEGCK